VPFPWAQLTAWCLPCSGPRSRTPLRSTSQRRVEKEVLTTFLSDWWHRGLTGPHFNHDMEGSSIHDKISPANGGAVGGNQLPL
jgi:hypothetical protein